MKTDPIDPVGITGLLVAAIRAEESTRPDRLFDDPFAAALAGDEGRRALARYRPTQGPNVPILEVRTRFFDEALERAWRDGVRQFVIVAAGMDARSYRLAWPTGTSVFELDQPPVLAHKERALAEARSRCERRAIPVDLAEDWPAALVAGGFDASARTAWLVEGLLQYLEEGTVKQLFARIDRLSAEGSMFFYDVVGASLLQAPAMAPMLAAMREQGAPWVFGTDQPESLVSSRWRATPSDPSDHGRRWNRWPFPPAPPGVVGIPRGYFIEARAT
jgi:methyltransferase (TIGR00027 family)